jgi:hypothetical protein
MRIGMAIILALCFIALIGFNLFSLRVYSKNGAKDLTAVRVIRMINAALLVGALGIVVWAMTRG